MGWRHIALVAALSLIWPLIFVGMAANFTRKIGPVVAFTTGKSLMRQLWEQICLALSHSIPPDKYYVFELFRDDRRARANDYILRYEIKGGLHNLLHFYAKQATGNSTKGILKDKLSFTQICRASGVDAPIILLYVDPNGTVMPEGQNDISLPQTHIFIKPAKGKGGRGCEKWTYQDERYIGPIGQILSEAELLTYIAALARRRGRYLVQECLFNNMTIRDLGELTSLRITTCRTENGNFEATNAVLKLALGGNGVDNFHQGGAVAKVEMTTGIIGPVFDSWINRPCHWYDRHPLTKAPIAGRVIPHWHETVRLVEKAHRLFPDRTMLGFDVAITDRGPVIIEGNVQSGCDMIQRTHDMPVGKQRLGELLAYHANKAANTLIPRKMNWFGPLDYFRRR